MNKPDPKVYTLDDLKEWSRPGVWLAVLGKPVAHSISPEMHNAALRDLCQRQPEYAPWQYVRFEIDPADLSVALPCFHDKGFYGLNLTVPHKVEALNLLEAIDPEAEMMGAVNTLVRGEKGYRGFNSDGYGLRTAIYRELGVALRDADIILLGAGGAARAAAVQCLKDGCRSLWIGNRSADRLEALQVHLSGLPGLTPPGGLHGFLLSEVPKPLPEVALVIQATTAGMNGGDASPPLSLDEFSGQTKVYDMVYRPAVTPLMSAAEARGMSTGNGLSMLVHQGVRSLEIWTQATISAAVMEKAALDAVTS